VFNDTAGSMAKDSVFNAASVLRKVTGKDLTDYECPCERYRRRPYRWTFSSSAVAIAILSAVTGKPVKQNIAITGEISIQGKVRSVGGIMEKIYGADRPALRQ